jgi:hypothetical protein
MCVLCVVGRSVQILHCLWLIAKDILSAFLFLAILLGIQRVCSFLRKSRRITQLYRELTAERAAQRKKEWDERHPQAVQAPPVAGAAPAPAPAAAAAADVAAAVAAAVPSHQAAVDELFIALLPPTPPAVNPAAAPAAPAPGSDMKAGDAEKAQAAAQAEAEAQRLRTNRTRHLLNEAIANLRKEDGLPTPTPLDGSGPAAEEYPLSLSFYRPLLLAEARLSFLQFYHVLLFPVRVLGFVFVPVHAYVEWRLGCAVNEYVDPLDREAEAFEAAELAAAQDARDKKKRQDEEKNLHQVVVDAGEADHKSAPIDAKAGGGDQMDAKHASPPASPRSAQSELEPGSAPIQQPLTLSVLFRAIIWLQLQQPQYKGQFRSLEKFLLVNLLTIPLLLLNEVGVVWMAGRALVMWCVSFGIRDNVHDRPAGYNPSACTNFWGYVSLMLQACVVAPAGLFVELLLIFAPVLIGSGSSQAAFSGAEPVRAMFTAAYGAWLVWIVFLVPYAVSWQLSYRVAYYHLQLFRPWLFWTQLMPLHAYGWLLGASTRACYSAVKSLGCIGKPLGEGGLIVVAALWIFWPSLPPILTQAYPWLGLTVPVNCVFVYFAVTTHLSLFVVSFPSPLLML